MAYVDPNYKTKKDFKNAVQDGVKHRPYNNGGMYPCPTEGHIVIEGPHYPKPHKWHAQCEVRDGIIVSVK